MRTPRQPQREKSYYGRGPTKAASVRFYDGYVGTVLEERLTRAEPSLVGRAHAPLVGEPCRRVEEAIAAELMRTAEQALGRRVLAHRTQVIPHRAFVSRTSSSLAVRSARESAADGNLAAVLLPPLAVVVAAVLSWNEFVEPVDLVILVVGYGLTCIGITVGFHRH